MSSPLSPLSEAPSPAESILNQWRPIEHRHRHHQFPTSPRPKPLTVHLLGKNDIDISFQKDHVVEKLLAELRRRDEGAPKLIELLAEAALVAEPTTYSSESTLSHRIEKFDGQLFSWILGTGPFTDALGKLVGGSPPSALCTEWELSADYGGGRADKTVLCGDLDPDAVASGEWKTSRVMSDDLRGLVAEMASRCRRDAQGNDPLGSLTAYVERNGNEAQLEVFAYPETYPAAAEETVGALVTLVGDSWAYGDPMGTQRTTITHDAAFGFRTRPTPADLNPQGSDQVEVALMTRPASMGVWLSAAVLTELWDRTETEADWSSNEEVEDPDTTSMGIE